MKIIISEIQFELIKKVINEEFLDEPKFYRFSNDDMRGIEDGIYKPKPRKLNTEGEGWIFSLFNNFNFPLQSRSINLMDKIAYGLQSNLKDNPYGSNEYEVILNDSSNLGWSFFMMQGQWERRRGTLFAELRPQFKFPKGLMNDEDFLNWDIEVGNNDNTMMNKYIETLLKYKVIGRGNISELLSSPFWGKVLCYVWTEDNVKINKI